MSVTSVDRRNTEAQEEEQALQEEEEGEEKENVQPGRQVRVAGC